MVVSADLMGRSNLQTQQKATSFKNQACITDNLHDIEAHEQKVS